jgi:hypothetical protein
MQRDGRKTWKDTKPKTGLSCCTHNCPMQNSGDLNSLKKATDTLSYLLKSWHQVI